MSYVLVKNTSIRELFAKVRGGPVNLHEYGISLSGLRLAREKNPRIQGRIAPSAARVAEGRPGEYYSILPISNEKVFDLCLPALQDICLKSDHPDDSVTKITDAEAEKALFEIVPPVKSNLSLPQ